MNYSVRTDADTIAERSRIEVQRAAFDSGIFGRAWMPIPGTRNRYEVSGAGLVRLSGASQPRMETDYIPIFVDDPRLLSPEQCWQGPKKYGVEVRRLVAAAFYGLPDMGWRAVVLRERTMDSAWDNATCTWLDDIELQMATARTRRWGRYVTNIRWATHSEAEERIIGPVNGDPQHVVVGLGTRHTLTAVGSWSNSFPGQPLEVDTVESYFDSYGQTGLDEAALTRYSVRAVTGAARSRELGERAASFSETDAALGVIR